MVRFSAGLFLLALAGCATPAPQIVHVCPSMPVYSQAFEASAAQELQAIPPTGPIWRMISDYAAVRTEIRECQK